MGYELERATLEAERNAAVNAYIEARPQLDSIHNRRIFEAGFERAWNARNNEIDRLRQENETLRDDVLKWKALAEANARGLKICQQRQDRSDRLVPNGKGEPGGIDHDRDANG